MRRTDEGGSVLGFIMVGIVLAVLLIGGLYFVNRRTDQPEAPPPQVQTPHKEDKKPEKQNKEREQSAQPAPQETSQASSAHELPTTGPADLLGTLFALGLMGGLLTGYLRSRRQLASL